MDKVRLARRLAAMQAAIGKKAAGLLILHLALMLHITEKFDAGHLPMLSLETKQRDRDDRHEETSD